MQDIKTNFLGFFYLSFSLCCDVVLCVAQENLNYISDLTRMTLSIYISLFVYLQHGHKQPSRLRKCF